jgi:DNA-binding MarR family transcriptional regulator
MKCAIMNTPEEIRYLMLAVQREGNRFFAERLRPLNLTASQAEVLRVLQEHQPLSLRELGNMLVCEHGSPSRLVDGLVERALVRRATSQTDARRVTLRLTEAGDQAVAQVCAIEAGMDQIILSIIQDTPIDAVKALFWRFIDGRTAGEALKRRMRREGGQTDFSKVRGDRGIRR